MTRFGHMAGMILAHPSRIVLRGIALTLGSLGVFCLRWSCLGVPLAAYAILCLGVPLAAYAIVCLGSATIIILASDSERRAGR